jgi:L-lactate dehydrogenase complex protein LldG
MMSREQILHAVKMNQPEELPLPNLDSFFENKTEGDIAEFTTVLQGIGALVLQVSNHQEIINTLKAQFKIGEVRVVSPLESFREIAEPFVGDDPHQLANAELVILPSHFAVAENGACWLSDALCSERVLPFITQHLVLTVNKADIVPTMHEAYARIGKADYGFGTFIAGPSKTADIAQSLVLGAHGPRSLIVFII